MSFIHVNSNNDTCSACWLRLGKELTLSQKHTPNCKSKHQSTLALFKIIKKNLYGQFCFPKLSFDLYCCLWLENRIVLFFVFFLSVLCCSDATSQSSRSLKQKRCCFLKFELNLLTVSCFDVHFLALCKRIVCT